MTDSANTQDERRMKRRGRLLASALMAVVALPMLIAYVFYHTGVGIPDEQVNEGFLLDPPQALAQWQPKTLSGENWAVDPKAAKHWRFIIPVDADCSGACGDNLYLTRQVHVRLAEKASRVERIILLLDGEWSDEALEELAAKHPGTRLLRADRERVVQSLNATNRAGDPLASGRYFLMDQEGYVMMAYSPEHTGNQLLKDIKRLLRYSYDD